MATHAPYSSFATRQRRYVRRLLGLAAAGFAAGASLGLALLSADTFALGALVATDASPLLVAALFTGGLGLIFMPASLATGLADPRRSATPDLQDVSIMKGRRR